MGILLNRSCKVINLICISVCDVWLKIMYATIGSFMWCKLQTSSPNISHPKLTMWLNIFWDYRQPGGPFSSKHIFFYSLEYNLASLLTEKTIENVKSFKNVFFICICNVNITAGSWNECRQPAAHLSNAGCKQRKKFRFLKHFHYCLLKTSHTY